MANADVCIRNDGAAIVAMPEDWPSWTGREKGLIQDPNGISFEVKKINISTPSYNDFIALNGKLKYKYNSQTGNLYEATGQELIDMLNFGGSH